MPDRIRDKVMIYTIHIHVNTTYDQILKCLIIHDSLIFTC